MKNKIKNYGFSLVELILVITFITVALGGVFLAYRHADVKTKVSQEVENEKTFIFNIRNEYKSVPIGVVGGSTAGRYNGISLTNLITDNIPPPGLNPTNSTSTLADAWGGTIAINSADSAYATPGASGDQNGFKIFLYNVPTDACIDFVSTFQTYVVSIAVNSTFVKTQSSPFSTTNTISQCSSTNNNVIDFEAYD